MRQPFSSLLLLCLVFLPLLAQAGPVTERIIKTKSLVLGTPGDFPPFSMSTADGKLIGLDIDLARSLAQGLDVELKVERMEFAKLLPALENGSIDIAMSGITMMPSRNLRFAFIGPYALSGQALLGKKEIIAKLADKEDLGQAKFHMAVLKGTTSEETAKAFTKATRTLTDTHDQSLILLLDGKVDVILADYPYCKVAEMRFADRDIDLLDEPLTFEPLGIAIAGNDPLLSNLVHNFLVLLEGGGILAKLKDRWFKSNDWMKELPDLEFFRDLELGE
jgi:polar amino acid transport system substrate-binding protein